MKQDVSANGSDWKIAAIARLAATCCRFVEVEKGHDGLFQQAVSIYLAPGFVEIFTISGQASQHLLDALIQLVKLLDEIFMALLQTLDDITSLCMIHRNPIASVEVMHLALNPSTPTKGPSEPTWWSIACVLLGLVRLCGSGRLAPHHKPPPPRNMGAG